MATPVATSEKFQLMISRVGSCRSLAGSVEAITTPKRACERLIEPGKSFKSDPNQRASMMHDGSNHHEVLMGVLVVAEIFSAHLVS